MATKKTELLSCDQSIKSNMTCVYDKILNLTVALNLCTNVPKGSKTAIMFHRKGTENGNQSACHIGPATESFQG